MEESEQSDAAPEQKEQGLYDEQPAVMDVDPFQAPPQESSFPAPPIGEEFQPGAALKVPFEGARLPAAQPRPRAVAKFSGVENRIDIIEQKTDILIQRAKLLLDKVDSL